MTNRVSLLDFVPRVSPRYASPRHLEKLTSLFERIARGEQVFACVACPPRHAKTDTIAHGLAWLLRINPELRCAYVSYAQTIAEKKSRRMRELAKRARVRLDPKAATLHDWRTICPDASSEPGGVTATSIGGPIVGEGVNVAVIDDPVKDRVTAESALFRDRAHEYVTDVLIPRGEPGFSCIVVMHRWHPDDLSGRLIADGWEEVCLSAIDDDGAALWPDRYSVEQLTQIRDRVGPYAWNSLYMGRPTQRGGAVFNGTHFYSASELPSSLRIVIGVDLAYTAKTSADRSVAVVLGEANGVFYVLQVITKQVAAPDFAATLQTLRLTYPSAFFASYIGGTEKGVIDLFRTQGIHIHAMPARADKFIRAQPSSVAWNAGRILLPREVAQSGESLSPAWVDTFINELCAFTGVNDRRDDQVDALVSGFDAMAFHHVAEYVNDVQRERAKRNRRWLYATNPYAAEIDPVLEDEPSMWTRIHEAEVARGIRNPDGTPRTANGENA